MTPIPGKAKLTRTHWHGGKRYAYCARHARWLVWHNSEIAACFSGWLPTTYQPSNVKR